MPMYRLPADVHAVSANGQEFVADENGQIDLTDTPREVIEALVTLAGVKPVADNHPPIPPVPPTPAPPTLAEKAAAVVAKVAEVLAKEKEKAAEAEKDEGPAIPPPEVDGKTLKLDPTKKGLTPGKRAKA